MATDSTIQSTPLKQGTYAPRQPTDVRSPCPAINALANHGYIPRDGRNVRAAELHSALPELGIGRVLASLLVYPIFTEIQDPRRPAPSWWSILRDPFAYMFGPFAMRNPGQVDGDDVACLNLDQFARPDCVEHDVSLSRLDHAQGDNINPQAHLIHDIVSSSTDGSNLTLSNLALLRKARIERQRLDNPEVHYQASQHQIACGEIALLLKVFGDGSKAPVPYVKAMFQEERLPREEGWTRRRWWKVGLLEMFATASKVKTLIGDFGGSGSSLSS